MYPLPGIQLVGEQREKQPAKKWRSNMGSERTPVSKLNKRIWYTLR